MVDAFVQAINHYKQSQAQKFNRTVDDAWVAFIVDDSERNVVDQKIIEVQLQLRTGIKSMRVRFSDVFSQGILDENNVLRINGKEIGFVYYRTGYQQEQYKNEDDWQARINLEVSQAVKCPSIDFHLSTFKKFQQSFCQEGTIHKILGNETFKELEDEL